MTLREAPYQAFSLVLWSRGQRLGKYGSAFSMSPAHGECVGPLDNEAESYYRRALCSESIHRRGSGSRRVTASLETSPVSSAAVRAEEIADIYSKNAA